MNELFMPIKLSCSICNGKTEEIGATVCDDCNHTYSSWKEDYLDEEE